MGDRHSGERYPAAWRNGDGGRTSGVLVLERTQFRLEGRRDGEPYLDFVPYAAIERVRTARLASERLRGPTLVVERPGRPPLLIEPHGLGLLAELSDALAEALARRDRH